MAKKKVDPSAAVRRDPAADLVTEGLKPRQQYTRFNVFVSEDGVPVWENFKIYAKSIGMNVSQRFADRCVVISLVQTKSQHTRAGFGKTVNVHDLKRFRIGSAQAFAPGNHQAQPRVG